MKKQEPNTNTRESTNSNESYYSALTVSTMKKFAMKELYFLLYHLSRLGLSIAIIVLIFGTSLSAIIKNKQEYDRVQQILQLWEKNVIVDIITVSTYNCPENYEPYTSESWPGTKEGCLCQASLGQYDYLHVLPGECSLKLINVGCTRINKQQSIPYAFWRTPKLICVKRIPGLNFYANLTQSLKNAEVRKCAVGTAYEIESLAVEDCPITDISNSIQTYPSNTLPAINFSFTHQSSYPIIDIKMTEYDFCLEYNRTNISPNRFQNYDLQIIQISNCNNSGDPRVRTIDSITEKQLFQANTRIYDVTRNQLPGYPHPTAQYIYKLGVVEYPPWSFQCRTQHRSQSNGEQTANLQQFTLSKAKQMFQCEDIFQKAQICIGATLVLVCIYGLLYSLISVVRHLFELRSRHKNGILFYPDRLLLQTGPNLITQPSLFCQISIFVLLIALALGLLVQLGIQYQQTVTIQNWFRNSYQCMTYDDGISTTTDPSAQYFVSWTQIAYVQPLQANIRTYLICVLCSLVVVCIDCVFLVWRLNRGDLQHENIMELFRNNVRDQSEGQINIQQKNNKNRNRDDKDKNSDENITDEKQLQQNNDQSNINIDQYEGEDDKFDIKDRQKTGDINLNLDLAGIDQWESAQNSGTRRKQLNSRSSSRKNNNNNNNRQSAQSRRLRESPQRRRNTLGKTRAVYQPSNQTEQSMIDDDEAQFNRITLGSMKKQKQKQKGSPLKPQHQSRPRRLHSFDFEQEEH